MDGRNENSYRNRRSATRRASRDGARFVCRKGALGLGANILARVGNVSQTGARLYLKTVVSIKDEVEVSVEGYGARAMKRLGDIAWVRPQEDGTFLVGIQFRKTISFAELQDIAKPL
jgi:hypothetical protein